MRRTLCLDLGRQAYRATWAYQEELMEEIKREKQKGEGVTNYLLLVEHDPVYTLGKSGDAGNMLISESQLKIRQAELIKVDRGGDITFHGPGQLVVYPVLDLESFGWGVKTYVEKLEEVVIRTLEEYGIAGERVEGATGVWLDAGLPGERKICAIGVKCSRYVTMHGFALNGNTDLNYFNYIHPCGFVDKGVTSLQKELCRPVDLDVLKQKVCKQFEEVCGMELLFRK